MLCYYFYWSFIHICVALLCQVYLKFFDFKYCLWYNLICFFLKEQWLQPNMTLSYFIHTILKHKSKLQKVQIMHGLVRCISISCAYKIRRIWVTHRDFIIRLSVIIRPDINISLKLIWKQWKARRVMWIRFFYFMSRFSKFFVLLW